MKKYGKVWIALGLFLVSQLVGAVIMLLVVHLLTHSGMDKGHAEAFGMAAGTTVGFALAAVLGAVAGCYSLKGELTLTDRSWSGNVRLFVPAYAGLMAAGLMTELLHLSDNSGNIFPAMSSNLLGMISVGLIGPIAEECILRAGVLGNLLRVNVRPWVAIVVSALIFGILHFNPVQTFFATLIGIIFGVVYYATRNIVLTSIIHIVNNSSVMIGMRLFGDDFENFEMSQVLTVPGTIILICLLTAYCVYGLKGCVKSFEVRV